MKSQRASFALSKPGLFQITARGHETAAIEAFARCVNDFLRQESAAVQARGARLLGPASVRKEMVDGLSAVRKRIAIRHVLDEPENLRNGCTDTRRELLRATLLEIGRASCRERV